MLKFEIFKRNVLVLKSNVSYQSSVINSVNSINLFTLSLKLILNTIHSRCKKLALNQA